MRPQLSVVIPLYNEEKRLSSSIDKIFSFLKDYPLSTEVIFVNDGSKDGTEALLKTYEKQYRFCLISYSPNHGKGYAVRQGALAARGAWVAFFDIDLATPLEELHQLRVSIELNNSAVVLGNRRMQGSTGKQGESFLRTFLGGGFTLLSRAFVPSVSDFTCGFKCFRRDAAERIFAVARIDRWAFDTELIYLARHFRFPIKQIPVAWAHDERSQVRVLKDVLSSLKELFLIAWYSVSGAYGSRRTSRSGIFAHWGAVCIAFLGTLLVVAPLIVFPYVAGNQYQGINIAHFATDEHYYLARMHEALAGHALGQPFLAEGKEAPDPTFSYVERAIAAPLRLVGAENVDTVTLVNALDAVGVFILILLLYAFIFRLSRNRLLAAATAFFVVCGYSIVYNKFLFYSDFNTYGRSFFPWASSVPFFAFLYFLYESVVSRRGIWYTSATTLFLGILFYTYFFSWTFAGALLFSLIVVYALARSWRQVRDICAIGAIGLLLGFPNLLALFSFYASPAGAKTSFFLFAQHAHTPVISAVGLATLAVALVYVWFDRKDQNTPFIWGIIFAGWIALNQQILSGRIVQYGHYYWYFIVPLCIIVISYFIFRLMPRGWRLWWPIALIVIALVNTAGGQYRSFFTTLPDKLREQAYAPILEKLNTEPPGTVFMEAEGDEYPFLVRIYTSDNLYWVPAAENHVFPVGRLEEALLAHLYLNRNARANPTKYLSMLLAQGAINEYTSMYEDLEGYRSGLDYYTYRQKLASNDPSLIAPRAALMNELAMRYKELFPNRAALRSLLTARGVRYVIVDPANYSEWDISVLNPMVLIASSTDLELYSIQGP